MKYVRIEQAYKRKLIKNKISGHSWPEDTLKNYWRVYGPLGIIARTKTYAKAEAIAQEHENFYNKYFPEGLQGGLQ